MLFAALLHKINKLILFIYEKINGIIKIKEDEVSDIKWLSYDEFKKLFYSNEFVGYGVDYKDLVVNTLDKYLKGD